MIYAYLFLVAVFSNGIGYVKTSYKKKIFFSFLVCFFINVVSSFFLDKWNIIPMFLISFPCFLFMMSGVYFGEIYFNREKK